MKLLTYSLITSMLFIFNWCEEEENCTAFPSSVDVNIYVKIIDESEEKTRCENGYAVDFWKIHCPGGVSTTMSYLYKGCYEDEGVRYVTREGIGTWSISLRDEEELLAVSLKEDNGRELYFTNIKADKIYSITNQGSKGLELTFRLDKTGTGFDY